MGSRSRYSLVTGVAAAVLLTAGPVFADTAPAASESTLDEVIVTAQKRSDG